MSRISKVQKTIKLKEQEKQAIQEIPQPLPEKVMVNTMGEVISINGIQFSGKVMVPRDYSYEINRVVQKRLDQRKREKEFKEFPDKRASVSGKVYK